LKKKREEGDEGWIDRFDNSKIYDEGREEYNRDELTDSKDKWEEIGLKLEDEWEGVVLTVKIRQPSHEFTFGVGMSFIPYPLVLTPVV
jgi:hypothetical protein